MTDDTLTMDKLRAAVAALDATRDPLDCGIIPAWRGMRVIVGHTWPRVRAPELDRTIRLPAHPFIKWLSRFLPIDPFVEVKEIGYRDVAPMIFAGCVHMSPAQYDALRKADLRNQAFINLDVP